MRFARSILYFAYSFLYKLFKAFFTRPVIHAIFAFLIQDGYDEYSGNKALVEIVFVRNGREW
jgi:hypothetical protein